MPFRAVPQPRFIIWDCTVASMTDAIFRYLNTKYAMTYLVTYAQLEDAFYKPICPPLSIACQFDRTIAAPEGTVAFWRQEGKTFWLQVQLDQWVAQAAAYRPLSTATLHVAGSLDVFPFDNVPVSKFKLSIQERGA